MIDLVLASLIPTATIIVGLWYLNRKIPDLIQNVLDSVGSQLKETFADPNVKRAFSILGSQSGEVRADNALREKAAIEIVGQSPIIEKALEQFGLTPLEGLKLLNDPLFQPLLQGFLSKMQLPGSEKKGGLP